MPEKLSPVKITHASLRFCDDKPVKLKTQFSMPIKISIKYHAIFKLRKNILLDKVLINTTELILYFFKIFQIKIN